MTILTRKKAEINDLKYGMTVRMRAGCSPALVKACLLASELNLRIWKDRGAVFKEVLEDPTNKLYLEYQKDPEAFYQQCLAELIAEIPAFKAMLQKTVDSISKATIKDYEGVFEIIIPSFDRMFEGEGGPEALLSMAVLSLIPNARQFLVETIPLFILHGPLEVIQQDEMLNRLADIHYEEYVTRLPAEDLAEFLTSENGNARIKAVNKIKAECA